MSKGFSLIEIMVVVVILGILGTFVAVNVFDSVDDARESKALSEVSSIDTAVKRFRLKTGKLPQNLRELIPNYIEEEDGLLDPWNNEYVYKIPGKNNKPYEMLSKGPDGQEGTADDITLTKKKADPAAGENR